MWWTQLTSASLHVRSKQILVDINRFNILSYNYYEGQIFKKLLQLTSFIQQFEVVQWFHCFQRKNNVNAVSCRGGLDRDNEIVQLIQESLYFSDMFIRYIFFQTTPLGKPRQNVCDMPCDLRWYIQAQSCQQNGFCLLIKYDLFCILMTADCILLQVYDLLEIVRFENEEAQYRAVQFNIGESPKSEPTKIQDELSNHAKI